MPRTVVIAAIVLLSLCGMPEGAFAQWHSEDVDRWSSTVQCSATAGWEGHTVRAVATLEEAPYGSASVYWDSDSGNQANYATASVQKTMGPWAGEVKCWSDYYGDGNYLYSFVVTIQWPGGGVVADSDNRSFVVREDKATPWSLSVKVPSASETDVSRQR